MFFPFSDSIIFNEKLTKLKDKFMKENKSKIIQIENNYMIMRQIYNQFKEIFSMLKAEEDLDQDKINLFFKDHLNNIEKEIKIMIQVYDKNLNQKNDFILNSIYIITYIINKEKYEKLIKSYLELFEIFKCEKGKINEELNKILNLNQQKENFKEIISIIKKWNILFNPKDNTSIVLQEMAKSNEIIKFILQKDLKEFYDYFEINQASEIEDIINITILLQSINDSPNKISDFINKIKTLLPDKEIDMNDENKKKFDNLILLKNISSLKDIIDKIEEFEKGIKNRKENDIQIIKKIINDSEIKLILDSENIDSIKENEYYQVKYLDDIDLKEILERSFLLKSKINTENKIILESIIKQNQMYDTYSNIVHKIYKIKNLLNESYLKDYKSPSELIIKIKNEKVNIILNNNNIGIDDYIIQLEEKLNKILRDTINAYDNNFILTFLYGKLFINILIIF